MTDQPLAIRSWPQAILHLDADAFFASVSAAETQYSLFDDTAKIERMGRIYDAVDQISRRFGKHTIQHAASLPTKLQARHEGERGDTPKRAAGLFRGENKRQKLGLPLLHIKV